MPHCKGCHYLIDQKRFDEIGYCRVCSKKEAVETKPTKPVTSTSSSSASAKPPAPKTPSLSLVSKTYSASSSKPPTSQILKPKPPLLTPITNAPPKAPGSGSSSSPSPFASTYKISDVRIYIHLSLVDPALGIQFLTAHVATKEVRDKILKDFPQALVTSVGLLRGFQPPAPNADVNLWARTSRFDGVEAFLRNALPALRAPSRATWQEDRATRNYKARKLLLGLTHYKHQKPDKGENTFEKLANGKYYGKEERRKYALTIRNGKIYDASGKELSNKIQYVMAPDNTLYGKHYWPHKLEDRKAEEFHTRFTAASGIRCAGYFFVTNNKIIRIGNDSGHYKPHYRNLLQLLDYLHRQGVPLKDVKLHVLLPNGGSATLISAEEFRTTRILSKCKKG